MKAVKKYSEAELVALLKKRDREAFSYLYDNYSAALYGIINTFIKDTDTANIILHDSFVKIWNQAEAFDDIKGRLFTWMSTIVRNTAIDTLRSKDWKNAQKNIELTDNNSRDVGVDNIKIDAIGLRKFVNNLKEEYKTVVEMCYFDGYSQGDISKATGIPLGTVKTRIRKGLIELRAFINNK